MNDWDDLKWAAVIGTLSVILLLEVAQTVIMALQLNF